MKRTVGFHVPSGAYHHRIAVTLPSRGILAPIAAGLGRARRPQAAWRRSACGTTAPPSPKFTTNHR